MRVAPASPTRSTPSVERCGAGARRVRPRGHPEAGRTRPEVAHAVPEPVHRSARPRSVGRADRQGRRPDRRDRRPLSARHRPRRRDRPSPHLPALGVRRALDATGVRLRVRTIDIGKFHQRPNEILLKGDLMDKQIVDIEGRKVIRVNDVSLDEIEGALHVVAVDVGAAGLMRRLGIEGPFRVLARGLGRGVPERYIDWEDVDPLDSTIASVRLRVPHSKLAQLHPADLASIIEQLAPARPCRRPRVPRRRGRGRRDGGDGAGHAGRRPGGPRPGARRRHPRGDEPGRRGRPRGRPGPGHPRRDPRRTWSRTRSRRSGAAGLPRGLGRRDHDDRVHRPRRRASPRPRRSTACASWSPTPRRSTTST